MTLATRCPNCQTAFRVVRDQLRVSQGWVRCGHCSEVFDASAYLIDWPASSDSGADPAEVRSATSEPPESSRLVQADAATATDSTGLQALRRETPASASGGLGADSVVTAVGQPAFASPPALADGLERGVREAYQAAVPSSRSSEDTSLMFPASDSDARQTTDTGDLPHFIKQAKSRSSRSVLTRTLWWILGTVAFLGLFGQWTLHERNAVSARWPWVQPLMQQLCQVTGCKIDAPRAALDDLSVEATTFNRVRGNTYRLSLAMRNKSDVPVALPLIELTLTDQQDQVIARKVLQPSQWAGGVVVMPPREDINGAVAFSTTLDRVAGYRVLAFYP